MSYCLSYFFGAPGDVRLAVFLPLAAGPPPESGLFKPLPLLFSWVRSRSSGFNMLYLCYFTMLGFAVCGRISRVGRFGISSIEVSLRKCYYRLFVGVITPIDSKLSKSCGDGDIGEYSTGGPHPLIFYEKC